MTFRLDDEERKRRARLQRLGDDDPICAVCGEDDDRCLERQHVAGQAYDDLIVILCRNCHRKQSDPTDNVRCPAKPSLLERAGHLFLGLAAFFAALAETCRRFGRELLEGVPLCPWPYGSASDIGGSSS